MSIASVEVVATKFIFDMRDCTVESDFGSDNFSPVLGILHVCGHVHVRSHESPGMD